ncbi:MAG: methyltransferase domain-containing protein, partial [Chloroflexota bacterium]
MDYTRLHVQQSYKRLQNSVLRADFHYIPFASNSIDYIFEIESICHATQIDKVLRDAYRVLKSGGVFTIYDGFRVVPSDQLSAIHLRARHLVEKPIGVDKGTLLDDFIAKSNAIGFTVTKKDNCSQKIM